MLLSEKRIRRIVKEEILKKSRKKRKIDEATEDPGPARRWRLITSILGISENPTEAQYDKAWDSFVKNYYSVDPEKPGQPQASELLSSKDVISALDKLGGKYTQTSDEEEKIVIFLKTYEKQGPTGEKEEEKEVKSAEALAVIAALGLEEDDEEGDKTFPFENYANQEIEFRVEDGRPIISDFDNMGDALEDALDPSVDKEDLDDVRRVFDWLGGTLTGHEWKPAGYDGGDGVVDAIDWLVGEYHDITGDALGSDVDSVTVAPFDPMETGKAKKRTLSILKKLGIRKGDKGEPGGPLRETTMPTHQRAIKARNILREVIRKQIRQLNEAPPGIKKRLSVTDTVPTGDTPGAAQGPGKKKRSLEDAKVIFDQKYKGKPVEAIWKKDHPTNPAGDGKYYPATLFSLDAVRPSIVTVKWKDGGKIQTQTTEGDLKKFGGKSSGSGKSGRYKTWDKKWPLEKYHKGDKVKELQTALQKHKKDLKDDNYFGPNTESAVTSHPVNKDKKKVVDEELFKSIIGWDGKGEAAAIATDSLSSTGGGGKGKVNVKGGPHYKFRQGSWASRAHEIIINPTGASQKLFNEYMKGKVKGSDLEGQEKRNVWKIRLIFPSVEEADQAAQAGISEADFKSKAVEIRTGRGIGGKTNVLLKKDVVWKALSHAKLLSKVPEQ